MYSDCILETGWMYMALVYVVVVYTPILRSRRRGRLQLYCLLYAHGSYCGKSYRCVGVVVRKIANACVSGLPSLASSTHR
jgi:hypothetical protein